MYIATILIKMNKRAKMQVNFGFQKGKHKTSDYWILWIGSILSLTTPKRLKALEVFWKYGEFETFIFDFAFLYHEIRSARCWVFVWFFVMMMKVGGVEVCGLGTWEFWAWDFITLVVVRSSIIYMISNFQLIFKITTFTDIFNLYHPFLN